MPEEIEFSQVFVGLMKRINHLESQVDALLQVRSQETRFVSSEQIDELTTKVEQNLTRKLRFAAGIAE